MSFLNSYETEIFLLNLPEATAKLPNRFTRKNLLYSSLHDLLKTQQHVLKLQADEARIDMLLCLQLASTVSRKQRQIAMLFSNAPLREPWL